jgi:hypothetical protein
MEDEHGLVLEIGVRFLFFVMASGQFESELDQVQGHACVDFYSTSETNPMADQSTALSIEKG